MNVREFKFTGTDVAADIREKYGYDGPLLPIYAGHEGAVVHKWHHYIPLYDRYLSRFRGQPVRFLEIGVFRGGSLEMWREFLGPEAVIFGIDIDPECAQFDGNAGQVRIGSQDDPAFLNSVIDEMGGIHPGYTPLLGYTVNHRELQPLLTYLQDNLHLDAPLVRQIGCVIGTHTGPGAFGIAFFDKELTLE